ncbi:MAG: exonuclease SbcCD subunit D [Candidatus Thorarchaeota archaeon]
MARILFVADIHIGIRYPYQIDYRTGLSQRTLDFVETLEKIVIKAIHEKIDIFVIAGDLFDRVNVGPTLLRQVREKIWSKFIASNIQLIIIGGNHDSPQITEKGAPFGELTNFSNCFVTRLPKSVTIYVPSTEEEIGFILIPYMTPTQLLEHIERNMGETIPRDKRLLRMQEWMEIWIKRQIQSLNTSAKFIVGHFFVSGSKIGKIPYPDQLPHEFVVKKQMLPLDQIDLAVFGHIHTPQTIYHDKVLIPGSIERVDFGEVNEKKGFYIYDTESKTLSFHSSKPRRLTRTQIVVPDGSSDPTNTILKQLPDTLEDIVLRLDISISPSVKKRINMPKLIAQLEKAFHYEILWQRMEDIKPTILESFTLDPRHLFDDYIKDQCKDFPYQKELLQTGKEILDEALLEVDE